MHRRHVKVLLTYFVPGVSEIPETYVFPQN